ncbi:hypothetical protein Q7C36_001929 [Tachysurus vachellii]|uniref:Uncharacterized protein n=1 Tax=Tachysurus vachellii TaxID=175792 RepID=A0AA88NVD6_TACVA|nr:hypothetical protein Q7C36_001929 [Tachysurus vachellii]
MKVVLVFIAVSFVALSCAVPVEEEHEREKRSSSGEYYRRFYPSSNGNSNQNWMDILFPLLLARILTPAPAPAPAPVPAPTAAAGK